MWCGEQDVDMRHLDEGQKWAVFVSLQILAWIGGVGALKRLLGYFLSHSQMGLSSVLIGKLLGCTDRNVRYAASNDAESFWRRTSQPERGHAKAKLAPQHAGPLAKYLSENPGARVQEILSFIATELGIEIGHLTLRRFIERYGLKCLRRLRNDKHEQSPLFWATRSTEAPLF